MMRSGGYGFFSRVEHAGDNCESLWLLAMESEYISFLVSLESEKGILEHYLACKKCQERLCNIIKQAESEDQLDEIFHRDLNQWIGTSSNSSKDCPNINDYIDSEAFIKARIAWRLKVLSTLATDAELELGHLSERIKEEKKNTTP